MALTFHTDDRHILLYKLYVSQLHLGPLLGNTGFFMSVVSVVIYIFYFCVSWL